MTTSLSPKAAMWMETWGNETMLCVAQRFQSNSQQWFCKAWGAEITIRVARVMPEFFQFGTRPALDFMFVLH